MNVLVTGARGFIGKNLVVALERLPESRRPNVMTFVAGDDEARLEECLACADIVFHLAGANRPETEAEFARINAGLTEDIVRIIESSGRTPALIFASSTQAERDNPYGRSKADAERCLEAYHERTGNAVHIYRLPNVFGKWSRPNYNSVVATFCHNISRGLDIRIDDPDHVMTLVYVDEVVRCFMRHLGPEHGLGMRPTVAETFEVSVGALAERLCTIRDIRKTLRVPDLSDAFTKYLYATYTSFLAEDAFASDADLKTDERGWLFELVKSEAFGQIFVSTTVPGVTRGNHYHDTKIEKFCLIQGSGIIRFRDPESDEIIEYPVDDQRIKIVDIPPGYTHSIENSSGRDMIVLFWANEIFDPDRPDTYWLPVLK